MKIGRNDPCPCGSGKKYKQCCLTQQTPPVDLLWYRLNSAQEKMIEKIMDYAETHLGPLTFLFAVGEFLLWPEGDEDVYDLIEEHLSLFLPWYLFNYLYDPSDGEEAGAQIELNPDLTLAENYLSQFPGRLDELQLRLLRAAVHSPYSFYEIIDFESGNNLTLKDILTGEQTRVIEDAASEMVEVGDILFGSIVTVDHVSVLMGISPVAIRPSYKAQIIDLRNQILKVDAPITREVLQIHSYDIRELYLHFYDALTSPLEMTNRDGEAVVFYELNYTIDEPHDAFEQLRTLTSEADMDMIMDEATVDEKGRIEVVEFPWMVEDGVFKGDALGYFVIDHTSLHVSVNSKERSERIAAEIERRLGARARLRETKHRSMEQVMDQESDSSMEELQAEVAAVAEDPQALEYMKEILHDHWQGWIDEKLPALGGKTPRQAAKTADGREALESILLEAHRPLSDPVLSQLEIDPLKEVRHKLGLNRPLKQPGSAEIEKQRLAYTTIKKRIVDYLGRRLDGRLVDLMVHLCRRLAEGDEFSLNRGKPEIWAAAIIHVVAELNFLFDPDNDIHLPKSELCDALGVKATTVANKARQIRTMCDIQFVDPRFTLPELVEMFSFEQTPEGFLVPKPGQEEFLEAKGFSTDPKSHLRAVPLKKETPQTSSDSTSDPRQSGLFEDDVD